MMHNLVRSWKRYEKIGWVVMRKVMVLISSMVFFLAFFILYESTPAGGYGWGYKKNSDHQVQDIGKYDEMLKKYGAYYVDYSGEKVVYLTFDNGYEQGYTKGILDVLKNESVPATF